MNAVMFLFYSLLWLYSVSILCLNFVWLEKMLMSLRQEHRP